MGARFGIKPIERRAAVGDVHVNVDEAGSDVKAGDIDNFSRFGGGNIFCDGSDFAAGNGNVHHFINVICGIDTWPPFRRRS